MIAFLLGSSLTLLLALKVTSYEPRFSTAEVVKIDGIYIFSDSQPVMPFDSLGVVELGLVSDTQYESIRTNLLKKARKSFSTADGLILKLSKKGLDKAVVIKFK